VKCARFLTINMVSKYYSMFGIKKCNFNVAYGLLTSTVPTFGVHMVYTSLICGQMHNNLCKHVSMIAAVFTPSASLPHNTQLNPVDQLKAQMQKLGN